MKDYRPAAPAEVIAFETIRGGLANANPVGQRSHVELAKDMREQLAREAKHIPIADAGQLYALNGGLFEALSLEQLAIRVGETFADEKHCKKTNDYRAIAGLVRDMCEAPGFFADAPEGVATASRFYRITAQGIESEPLSGEHRQRHCLPVDPDLTSTMPLFDAFLQRTFAGDDCEEQIRLLQEIAGATIARQMPRLQKAVLFYGRPRSGKSTLLDVLTRLVPAELVASTSPVRWDHPYFVAALAGKLVNVVGELPARVAIPAAVFKQVLGGDIVEGRHPSHRPFTFRNSAAHIFNSNALPTTEDFGDGFFRRWAILDFRNPLSAEDVEPGYEARLALEELPAILGWALRGAARVAQQKGLSSGVAHERLLQRWRCQASSVLEFLFDDAVCTLTPGGRLKQGDLFNAYATWCEDTGRKRLQKRAFLSEIDNTGHVARVTKRHLETGDYVFGVHLAG